MPRRKRHFVVVKRGDSRVYAGNDGSFIRFDACTDADGGLVSVSVATPLVALDMIDALQGWLEQVVIPESNGGV